MYKRQYENRPDFGPIFGTNLTPRGSIWTATGPGAPHGETKEIRIVSFFVILRGGTFAEPKLSILRERLHQIGRESTRLDATGPEWTRLDQTAPDWTSLDQIGPDWTSLGKIGSH